MAVSKDDILRIIQLIEIIEVTEELIHLKNKILELDTEEHPTNIELDELAAEFCKLFRYEGYRYLARQSHEFVGVFAGYMFSRPDKFLEKSELYLFLAQKPELCQMLSDYVSDRSKELDQKAISNFDGLTELSIRIAEKFNNVPFFLLAVQNMSEHEHIRSMDYWYIWSLLNNGIIALARKNVDIAPIRKYLVDNVSESFFSSYGKLLKNINRVQNKNDNSGYSFINLLRTLNLFNYHFANLYKAKKY